MTKASPRDAAAREPAQTDIEIIRPRPDDAPAVYDLVSRCPPLERNSMYCNLVQCAHFSDTSALACCHGNTVGFVSGYVRPDNPRALFVWQVAVDARARGIGLARRMINDILRRSTSRHLQYVHTTVSPDNRSSRRMFDKFARDMNADVAVVPGFGGKSYEQAAAAQEDLLVIGPFSSGLKNANGQARGGTTMASVA